MKRITFLAAVIALTALLLPSSFATRAGASKGGPGVSVAGMAKRETRRDRSYDRVDEKGVSRIGKRFRASGKESPADSKPGAFKRVGNFFKNLFGASNIKPSSPQESTGSDPDVNSRFGVRLNRMEYMRQRDEMIGLLRGLPAPDGISSEARSQAIREMERQQRQMREAVTKGQLSPEISGTTWTPIGPAPIPLGQTSIVSNPVSGRTTAIAIHPTDPNTVYVGTAQGGLYRTLNGGTTWVPLMDNALSMAIGSVAIDPNTPTTIYVGTGEGGFGGGQFFGVGIYRIINAATTPVLEGPFNIATNTSNGLMANSRGITKILVNPNDSNVVFVTTSSGANGLLNSGIAGPNPSPRGIYRSVNALSATPTFQKLNIAGATGTGTNPGANLPMHDMEFEPGNPNNLLVGANDSLNTGHDGVWRSTNALAADNTTVTFTKTLAGLCLWCDTQIAINKVATVVTVYAALESGSGGEVKKSIDGGVTWGPSLPTATGFCGGQCFYDMAVAVDPTNALAVLIGGSGDYDAFQTPNKRSVDGTNFVKASTGLHPDTHAIEFAPSNPLIVYHGNDGGIFKSTDGGATWTSLNNTTFSATQFVDISTHPTDPNFMIGGTQDNGTPFFQPESIWKLGDFGDGGYSLIDQNATDTTNVTSYHTYFNQTNNQMLFVRANNRAEIDPGATGWPTYHGCLGSSSNNGIICSDAVLFYAPMAQGPGNPNTIYYGAQHLFRSADQGNTMPAVSQLFNSTVSAIGISRQTDNARIVGLSNGGLWGTSTGANPMVNLDPANTVPNAFISRAIIDPNDNVAPYTAYVTLNQFGLAAGAHVYKTTNLADAGTTWTLSGTGIPDVPTNTIVVDPQNSNHLYAGTDIGVYISQNAGASWTPFGSGLPRVAVFDMEFQARNNGAVRVLRIATHGRGIWEITPLAPTAANGMISGRIIGDDGNPVAGAVIELSGTQNRRSITDANGSYAFDDVETTGFYTVTPALLGYEFSPANRSFSALGNRTEAMFTASRTGGAALNAIDSPNYFVRQQYLDFLGREPDESGFNFWSDQIASCGANTACVETKRINVSAAYFLSTEFQRTGGLVDKLYRASFGRAPKYVEFVPDTATMSLNIVVGQGDWEGQLRTNQQAFVQSFVNRGAFREIYDGLNNSEFVSRLIEHTGVNFSESDRNALISSLNNGGTRADVLLRIAENERFIAAKRNEAFVMMEYFGYLRRDPDPSGYDFWLRKLNQFNGNFERAEMVKAFINSGEYRARFGR